MGMTAEDLFAAAVRAGRTGDGTLDFVRASLALRGTDPDEAREVNVSPLPCDLREYLDGRVFLKACYHNTWEAMKKLRSKETRYVLGYWNHIIPVEHCFLKIGDAYHDPTAELLFGDEETRYFAILELTAAEVRDCMRFMRQGYRNRDYIGEFEWRRYQRERS